MNIGDLVRQQTNDMLQTNAGRILDTIARVSARSDNPLEQREYEKHANKEIMGTVQYMDVAKYQELYKQRRQYWADW